jgi:hypothetical protein
MGRFALCAFVVVVAGGCAKTPPVVVDRGQIERAVCTITDSVAAAVGRKDVPRLGALLSSAQYIGSGQLIPPGRFAEMAGPSFQQIAAITLTWGQREVRILSPDAVLMTARGTNVTHDAAGHAASDEGLYTMVFTSDSAGAWRLVSIHKSTGAQLPPALPQRADSTHASG